MAASFFFYDLETTGTKPAEDRIMQFAGQRTDLDLQNIGEPINVYIKLSDDVLPNPDAVLLTGITPQTTLQEGLTESGFLELFHRDIATDDTIFIGYNSIRFDDEFMRYLHYRNFYDAYEWEWSKGRSRWDMLDMVRMTRALRPNGIEWPKDKEGKATNKLEYITKLNGLDHEQAHDALNDIQATIAVARLIKQHQPKLFSFLFKLRTKEDVQHFIDSESVFVYTSNKYPSEFEKTTIVETLVNHPHRQGVLVYDLRHDPTSYKNFSVKQLVEAWRFKKDSSRKPANFLPIKTLQFNRCPAIAPLSVLEPNTTERLKLDMTVINNNRRTLTHMKAEFGQRVLKALEILDKEQEERQRKIERFPDQQLYDGFFDNYDKKQMEKVRSANPENLYAEQFSFHDERLQALLLPYKFRNFRQFSTETEHTAWEKYRMKKLLGGGTNSQYERFATRLREVAMKNSQNKKHMYIIEELQLYAESIMPSDDFVA